MKSSKNNIKLVKRCLISVFDKTGIDKLVKVLSKKKVEIVSTGSTANYIESLGVKVLRVENLTTFPEILDGRVKTLHPVIHGGILADSNKKSHINQIDDLGISPFDLVVVNLYPFVDTIKNNASFDDSIEKIDIGGPSMIRGAAKNFASVMIVTDSEDYSKVADMINKDGGFTIKQRFDFAKKAFQNTANYDIAIANWFNIESTLSGRVSNESKNWIGKSWELKNALRYGENSHQNAEVYQNLQDQNELYDLANAKLLNGKEMSFNNYVDVDAAYRSVLDFENPAVSIIKHSNPCGIAVDKNVANAYQKAFDCDSVSAYGSVVASNTIVSLEMAQKIKPIFTEALIAPGYHNEALELLKSKKNMRILECPISKNTNTKSDQQEIRQISGGVLIQDKDVFQADGDSVDNWQLVAGEMPNSKMMDDLEFAWRACRSVKSNAILLAKNGSSIGIGMGQVNRLDSCALAIQRANTLDDNKNRTDGCVAASDAFFPFADGLIQLAKAGVKAIVSPGGSIRDEEVIDAANEYGVSLFFTNTRHFFH